jgi:hypothetical protein
MTPTWPQAEPCTADQPIPYTLTAKAEALFGGAEVDHSQLRWGPPAPQLSAPEIADREKWLAAAEAGHCEQQAEAAQAGADVERWRHDQAKEANAAADSELAAGLRDVPHAVGKDHRRDLERDLKAEP